MYPRTHFEMSDADLATLLDAMKPVPAMMIGGSLPTSRQENANRAWAALGAKMGFDPMTVQPVGGKGQRFFSAVPSENEAQRSERSIREAETARLAEIEKIKREIAEKQERLASLSALKAPSHDG